MALAENFELLAENFTPLEIKFLMGLAVLINQSLKIKFLWLSWQPLTAQKSVGVPTHAGGFLLIEKFFGEAQARAGREFPSPRPPFLPAPPERIFRNQRRGFLGKKSELFPTNTTTYKN